MKLFKYLSAGVLAVALVACGGGGGSAGKTPADSPTSNTPGNSATGDQQTTSTASMSIDVLSGAGIKTNSISAVEISTVQITLKDADGKGVPGAVVTFSESGVGLLSFAPVSSTALTDEKGIASIEIRAATTASVGATTVGASAKILGEAIAAQKAIAIASAPAGGVVASDPQALANAMNFLDVNPADKSIVLAGAGGNGRSESATLRFRVVDKNNTPVKGAMVTFAVVPANDVTLNIPSAASDSDGVVVTTVSSKSVATAVVIKATVTRTDSSSVTSQSDQLLVTTGVVTQAGFDLSATKYNLNFGITGDSSEITVAIVDANGNPVADGVPVVFTANFGAVGTSSRGGCTTINGRCTVTYTVQDPRPADGTRARVTASTRIGNGEAVSGFLEFTISNLGLANLYSAASGGSIINTFNAPPKACKFTVSAFVGTPTGFPAPSGTTIEIKGITTDFSGSLKTGSPVLDLQTQRTPVSFELDASSSTLNPACYPNGLSTATAQVEVKFTAGSRVTTLPLITVTYPK